jgi:predicted DNA-binding transcriptional regulator YafY
VAALHANTTPLRWVGTAQEQVDLEALVLLAQACRDHEQVRFDHRRRDGDEARRLVEPHHLASAGSRWYLVAWDVRRDGWRRFRVDRLDDARLTPPPTGRDADVASRPPLGRASRAQPAIAAMASGQAATAAA